MTTPELAGTVLADVRDVQPPILAALLIGGSAAKLARVVRTRSPGGGLGPTELFPPRLRRPLTMIMIAVELSLGLALLVTMLPAGTHPGVPLFAPRAATGARVATAAFFLVAGAALIELRGRRPGLGCGCFGELSSRPPGMRSIARAAMLTVAALISVSAPALYLPPRGHGAMLFLGLILAELALLVALSPEAGEALVRLGYTGPCELRTMPAGTTLAALRRSRPWRRYRGGIAAERPDDIWRELCWRYLAFPYRQDEGAVPDADIVFAVELKRRRPAVRAVVVPRGPGGSFPDATLSGSLPESSDCAREPDTSGETGQPRAGRPRVRPTERAGTGRNGAR